MPIFDSETSRVAARKRWDRVHAEQHLERSLEERIREVVESAPPLSERQRARLARIILNAPEARSA